MRASLRARLGVESLETREVPALLNPVTFPNPGTAGPIDFNNDGIEDTTTVSVSSIRSQVSIGGLPNPRTGSSTMTGYITWSSYSLKTLLGNGDGTYRTGDSVPIASNLPDGTPTIGRYVGDFNGDGNADVLVSLRTASAYSGGHKTVVKLLAGAGDGTIVGSTTLATVTKLPTTTPPTVADVNGDGHLDFFIGGANLYLNNGSGSFQTVPLSSATTATGDFNGDGIADQAALHLNTGTVRVSLGNANGTFQPALSFSAGPNPVALTAVDLDGDGDLDLVVKPTSGLTVLRNDGVW